MRSSLVYPLPGSLTEAQHQHKGGRMFHPGCVSGLKLKAHCEGPDPPGCGKPSIGTVCPWNRDQQGIVQMKSICLTSLSPLPETAANRNSSAFSTSRRALGFSTEPVGFPPGASAQPFQPQPGPGTTLVSRAMEHLLPPIRTRSCLSPSTGKRCLAWLLLTILLRWGSCRTAVPCPRCPPRAGS